MISDPLLRQIHACVLAGVPCYVVSAPGLGKTARVTQYSAAILAHLERWLLSRCEPIDIKPRVYHEGKIVVSSAPEVERLHNLRNNPEVKDRLDRAGVALILGVLFADEVNRATRATEGATLDVFDSRPEHVAIIAAGNPPARGQSCRSLDAATANRFCHLHAEADPKAWANARIGGWRVEGGDFPWPTEKELAPHRQKVAAYIASFIRARGELLCAPPDDPVKAGQPWGSPRTWEMAEKLHAVALALGWEDDVLALISGCVGPGPATEYLKFCADADLPDPEDLLADPKSWQIDVGRVDRTVVALTAVAGAIEAKIDDKRWKAAWKLADVAVDADQTDAGVIAGYLFVDVYTRLGKKDKAAQNKLTAPQDLMNRRIAAAMV